MRQRRDGGRYAEVDAVDEVDGGSRRARPLIG
jgi:hypothetical protein